MHKKTYMDYVPAIADKDVETLKRKDGEYGGSWLIRGGVGAFMMAARKWDRIETQVKKQHWDIISAAVEDRRPEGILDDLADLRAYTLLIEAEVRRQIDNAETQESIIETGGRCA
jgi:hypothetical protein